MGYGFYFFGEKNESYKLKIFFQKMLMSQKKRIVPKTNATNEHLFCIV
jgi:hypothetical protein